MYVSLLGSNASYIRICHLDPIDISMCKKRTYSLILVLVKARGLPQGIGVLNVNIVQLIMWPDLISYLQNNRCLLSKSVQSPEKKQQRSHGHPPPHSADSF
jgi:hypothetical protein